MTEPRGTVRPERLTSSFGTTVALDAIDLDIRPVHPLLDPGSVAIIGASDRRADVVRTALRSGLRTWLVNPHRQHVLGEPCFPATADLPERPDVAMVIVGHRAIEKAVAEALDAGAAGLVIPGLGAEAGAGGAELSQRVASLAHERGVPVLGTNCMGFARPDGPSLWIGALSEAFVPGHVSVVSQSGSVAEALVAVGPRVGYRVVVSSGAEVLRDAADFVGHLARDERTLAVGLFLEAVRRPAAFARSLASCAEAGKPVVCLKVGRSATAAAVALTHTGAMVGSAQAFSALLRAYGAIEVDDVPELVETLETLGRRRRPRGTRTVAVSESGGEAGLLADHAEAAGLELTPLAESTAAALTGEFPNFLHPQNPLDAWAVDEVDRVFPRSLELLAGSGSVDILIAQLELTRFRSAADQRWCESVLRGLAAAAGASGLFPAVISSTSSDPATKLVEVARDADVALLRGTRAAARALAQVARWRPRVPPPSPDDAPIDIADVVTATGALPEWESATLLARYGVGFAPFRRARTPADAAAAAMAIGFPVVVKVDGPPHKTAVDGVVLGLTDAEAVRAAAARLGGAVLVARQLAPGVEICCGMYRDPSFGPVVSVGVGGRESEAFGTSGVCLAPLSPSDADELVETLPTAGLIGARARAGVADTIRALARLGLEHAEVESVDVNPLLLCRDAAVAVDALVVVGTSSPPAPGLLRVERGGRGPS